MRKLSEINEGMWKSGVNRAKTDTTRIGDLPSGNHNIDDFEPVDFNLPFLFSDVDLYLDGDIAEFNDEEKNGWLKVVKKQGWRLPTVAEISKYFLESFDSQRLKSKFDFEYTSYAVGQGYCKLTAQNIFKRQTAQMMFYLRKEDKFPVRYWLADGELEIVPIIGDICGFKVLEDEKMSSEPKRLRFVKDKK